MIENNSTGEKSLKYCKIYTTMTTMTTHSNGNIQSTVKRTVFPSINWYSPSIVGVKFSEMVSIRRFLRIFGYFCSFWNYRMICVRDLFRRVKWKPEGIRGRLRKREKMKTEKRECEKMKKIGIINGISSVLIYYIFISILWGTLVVISVLYLLNQS